MVVSKRKGSEQDPEFIPGGYTEEEEEYEEDIPTEKPKQPLVIPMDICDCDHTVHDSGILIGAPAMVLRMVGCNLSCIYCDVIKKRPDRSFKSDSIIPLLVTFADIDLVITGGEPFIQPDALGFLINTAVQARREFGYTTNVMVVTNGTINPEILRRNKYDVSRVDDETLNSVIWSINPKLHSSREEWSKTRFTDFFKFTTVEVKLTVNPYDADDIIDMKRIVSLVPENINLVVQPVVKDLEDLDFEAYQKSLNELYTIITDERLPRIRVIPQLHKIMWGMTHESM